MLWELSLKNIRKLIKQGLTAQGESMKVLMILAIINSFNMQSVEVDYRSNSNEQVVSYQVEHESKIKESVNNFIRLLNKYILKHKIVIMDKDDYIDFFSIF